MLLSQVWFNSFEDRCHVQVEEELEDKQGCKEGYTSHLNNDIKHFNQISWKTPSKNFYIVSALGCSMIDVNFFKTKRIFFNTIILFQDILPGADSESEGRDDVSPGGARTLSEDSAFEGRFSEQARCVVEIVEQPRCALDMVEEARRAAVKWLKVPGALPSCCCGSWWLEGS